MKIREMKPESLLALRQAVDERLSTEQVETILNSIENKENSGNLLKRISDEAEFGNIVLFIYKIIFRKTNF